MNEVSTHERFIEVSGRRVRIRVRGEGQPVLLINGLGSNVTTWTPLLGQLGDFEVISFDAPGTGRSQTPLRPYTMSRIADVARRVLDTVGRDSVDVLGYSHGGAVAQQLALDEPGRVRRLVLVSTSCGAGAVPGSLRALLAVMTPARHYARSGHQVTMKMVNLAPAERQSTLVTERAGDWHQEAAPSVLGYTLQMSAFSTFHSLPWLHRLEQPTLVLSGAADRLMPMANSAVLAAYLPHARLLTFDRWGHYLLHDPASGAGDAVADFLASADYEASATWRRARTVSRQDMADLVHSAPRSAHPSSMTNGLVRRLYRPKTRED